jgi:hypothetical protein
MSIQPKLVGKFKKVRKGKEERKMEDQPHYDNILAICNANGIPVSGSTTCGKPGCECVVPKVGPFKTIEEANRAAQILQQNTINSRFLVTQNGKSIAGV